MKFTKKILDFPKYDQFCNQQRKAILNLVQNNS